MADERWSGVSEVHYETFQDLPGVVKDSLYGVAEEVAKRLLDSEALYIKELLSGGSPRSFLPSSAYKCEDLEMFGDIRFEYSGLKFKFAWVYLSLDLEIPFGVSCHFGCYVGGKEFVIHIDRFRLMYEMQKKYLSDYIEIRVNKNYDMLCYAACMSIFRDFLYNTAGWISSETLDMLSNCSEYTDGRFTNHADYLRFVFGENSPGVDYLLSMLVGLYDLFCAGYLEMSVIDFSFSIAVSDSGGLFMAVGLEVGFVAMIESIQKLESDGYGLLITFFNSLVTSRLPSVDMILTNYSSKYTYDELGKVVVLLKSSFVVHVG